MWKKESYKKVDVKKRQSPSSLITPRVVVFLYLELLSLLTLA
jgi:hypothetical protein